MNQGRFGDLLQDPRAEELSDPGMWMLLKTQALRGASFPQTLPSKKQDSAEALSQLQKCLTGGNRALVREKLLVIVLSEIKIFLLFPTKQRGDSSFKMPEFPSIFEGSSLSMCLDVGKRDYSETKPTFVIWPNTIFRIRGSALICVWWGS